MGNFRGRSRGGCALRTHAEMEIGHEVITDKFVDGIVADGPQTGDNNCWNGFVERWGIISGSGSLSLSFVGMALR